MKINDLKAEDFFKEFLEVGYSLTTNIAYLRRFQYTLTLLEEYIYQTTG